MVALLTVLFTARHSALAATFGRIGAQSRLKRLLQAWEVAVGAWGKAFGALGFVGFGFCAALLGLSMRKLWVPAAAGAVLLLWQSFEEWLGLWSSACPLKQPPLPRLRGPWASTSLVLLGQGHDAVVDLLAPPQRAGTMPSTPRAPTLLPIAQTYETPKRPNKNEPLTLNLKRTVAEHP